MPKRKKTKNVASEKIDRRKFLKKAVLVGASLSLAPASVEVLAQSRKEQFEKIQVGACGICCDTCGLKAKGICQGCAAGDSPEAVKKVEFLKSINALCPVLDCAVKKKIAFCSRDCEEFPCQIFEGEYPYSKAYLGMYKSRIKQK